MQRLRQEIIAFVPDIVHANFGTMTALVCALISPVPLVITFHGQDLNPSPGVHWLRLRASHVLSRIAARRATQIVCVSKHLRERLSNIRDRVHVLPCGINMERFRPMQQDECRAKLGWSMDEKVVVFNAGSDPIRKRIDIAQAAFEHAKQSIPNARLHVFKGNTHPNDMPVYYGAADCLLVTSDYEGSPMVVKEAMACNLPVVSVNVGDVVERLSGVNPSIIVDQNSAALGEGLVGILRQTCRSNGREQMHDLSEDAIARKLVSIYRLAAGTASKSDTPIDAHTCVMRGPRRYRQPATSLT